MINFILVLLGISVYSYIFFAAIYYNRLYKSLIKNQDGPDEDKQIEQTSQSEISPVFSDISTSSNYLPSITIIIPAYNEKKLIGEAIDSVLDIDYPNFDLIVVDDGSTDQTYQVAKRRKDDWHKKLVERGRSVGPKKIQVLSQVNQGKSVALNTAIRDYTKSKIVVCLDADSKLSRDALIRAVRHFQRDSDIVGLSSYVTLREKSPGSGWLIYGLQMVEYVISHGLKRGTSHAGMDYVLGGVGSFFIRKHVLEVGGYDHDIVTEDIGLTFKLISLGLPKRIHFASDVIAYTDPVQSFRDLFKQRYRWAYGWFQTILKYKYLIFNRDQKYRRTLTSAFIPFLLLSQSLVIIQPIILILFIIYSISSRSLGIFIGQFIVLELITLIAILLDTNHQSPVTKGKYFLLSILTYPGMMIFNLLYMGIIFRCYYNLHKIYKDNQAGTGSSRWEHVQRG